VRKYLEEKNKELVAAAPKGRRNDEEEDKIKFVQAEIAMIPNSRIELPKDKLETFLKMIDALEDNDDVQNVYHNVEIPDDEE
jgi:transcriptional/translational regulatory protein YebC/TACO1